MQNIMQQDQPEQKQKNQVLRFIKAQLVVTVVLSAAWMVVGYIAAYSALVGGLIATVANAWFAAKIFRRKGKSIESSIETAETVLTTFYVGEIYKFIFTGAMFFMAFVLIKPISAIALLVTYFLIHLTPAVVSIFMQDDAALRDKEK
jgi:ATP synthase protein I